MKSKNKKFKLGLALGSGGAHGIAHIGAIKAFEEEGIVFDMISGCSIGSVVGALYAKGYSSNDMLSLLNEYGIFSVEFSIFLATKSFSLVRLINQFTGGAHFSDLKKPFRAVAVDLESGKEVIFSSGDLAVALAASSAIPPFKPIYHGGRLLVDGAFLNFVPADLVRDMGADFVLSINLGKGKDTNQGIKRILDQTYPKNKIPLAVRSKKCYAFSDFVLEPDLSAFSSADIRKVEERYKIGYQTAKSSIPKIKKLIKTKQR